MQVLALLPDPGSREVGFPTDGAVQENGLPGWASGLLVHQWAGCRDTQASQPQLWFPVGGVAVGVCGGFAEHSRDVCCICHIAKQLDSD